jgi:hypothetical protein
MDLRISFQWGGFVAKDAFSSGEAPPGRPHAGFMAWVVSVDIRDGRDEYD